MELRFLKYEPNQDPQAKFKGIVSIMVDGKFILRYKVQTGKTGGTFFQPPSVFQNDSWHQGFSIDSNWDNEEINHFMRQNLNKLSKTPDPLPGVTCMHVDEEVPF